MYPVPNKALELFQKNYRQVAEISFPSLVGSTPLTEKDIISGGLSVNRYCASGEKLGIGTAASAELTLKLDNRDGKFNSFVFEGKEMLVKIGIKKWDAHRWENAQLYWIPLGYFTADEVPRKLSVITLKALDRMVKFDKPVAMSQLPFPMTIVDLVRSVCLLCGVTLDTDVSELPNGTYAVSAPEESNLTYRQLIMWAAEITGTCAFIDWNGELVFSWVNSTDFDIGPSARFSSDIYENALTVTGVRVVTDDAEYLSGTGVYPIEINGNELISANPQNVAQAIYGAVGGLTYTPFEASVYSAPFLWPLDEITYVDKAETERSTVITSTTFVMNANTALVGSGETLQRASYAPLDPFSRRERALINQISRRQAVERETITNLCTLIAGAAGLYTSVNDGKYYLHDAPTLTNSDIVYTLENGEVMFSDSGWRGENTVWSSGAAGAGRLLLRLNNDSSRT